MHHQQLSLQSQMIAASALAELADEVKATPWPMFTRAKILDMIAAVRSNWAEPRVIEMSEPVGPRNRRSRRWGPARRRGELPELLTTGARFMRRSFNWSCVHCGCTDTNACIDATTGNPCYWVAPRMCSACAGRDDVLVPDPDPLVEQLASDPALRDRIVSAIRRQEAEEEAQWAS